MPSNSWYIRSFYFLILLEFQILLLFLAKIKSFKYLYEFKLWSLQVADELKKRDIQLFLACCNEGVVLAFPRNDTNSKIDQAWNIFPTIHDAVVAAIEGVNIAHVYVPVILHCFCFDTPFSFHYNRIISRARRKWGSSPETVKIRVADANQEISQHRSIFNTPQNF